jgi:hypothetical protein
MQLNKLKAGDLWHIREGKLLFYTKICAFSTKFCAANQSHPNFVDPMCSSVMQQKIVESLSNIFAIN